MCGLINIRSLAILALTAGLLGSTARADVGLSYYVRDAEAWQEPLGSVLDRRMSDAPMSPTSDTISVAIGPSAADAQYDLLFDSQSILLISAIQQAFGYTHPWESGARARAAIAITPTTPVEVSVEGTFTYDFTGWDTDGDTSLGLGFEITLIESQTVLYDLDASPILFPGAGTATLTGSFTLPAGQAYNIGIDSFTYTFRDINGNTATAQSEVTITVRAVPEPLTAISLLLGALAMNARRR